MRAIEELENSAASVALRNCREDAHGAAAGVADEDLDGEDALHERGPGEPTEWAGVTSASRAITAHANKAAAEQATGEELVELAFDEARIAEPVLRAIAGALEERWEVVADDAGVSEIVTFVAEARSWLLDAEVLSVRGLPQTGRQREQPTC